ncbi:MAG: prolipoprotein diacylglyceryl transferase [Endozoicomonadaceae bacterium]|nr:prolipoprotein diacylglyceryl transferase [Endozoicomonadaceae bacterium]MCY4330126.1 prolipoprotein diacylglyceryl transferase [Endozoicomonadaceae bacterium]
MLTYPIIDPVLLQIGPLSVHWYGTMYLLGFLLAWVLGRYRCRHSGGQWDEKKMGDMVFYGAIGVIAGGRIGYVLFYNFTYYLHHPEMIFALWDGGMSFHGGFAGVILVLFFYRKKLNKSWLQMTDFSAPLVPLGLAAGRIGNFINGELWGRVTDVPWAMVFPQDPLQLPRHPSQLYEFFFEGIVLFVILWFFSKKTRPTGAVSALFLIGYGTARFVIEFFRQPDEQLSFIAFGWMTRGQELSLPMVILGIGMLLFIYSCKQKQSVISQVKAPEN